MSLKDAFKHANNPEKILEADLSKLAAEVNLIGGNFNELSIYMQKVHEKIKNGEEVPQGYKDQISSRLSNLKKKLIEALELEEEIKKAEKQEEKTPGMQINRTVTGKLRLIYRNGPDFEYNKKWVRHGAIIELKNNTTLGRLPDNNIVTDFRLTNVSRTHCTFKQQHGQWAIVDHSTNGTTIVRARQSSVVHRKYVYLHHHDLIIISNMEFMVE